MENHLNKKLVGGKSRTSEQCDFWEQLTPQITLGRDTGYKPYGRKKGAMGK